MGAGGRQQAVRRGSDPANFSAPAGFGKLPL